MNREDNIDSTLVRRSLVNMKAHGATSTNIHTSLVSHKFTHVSHEGLVQQKSKARNLSVGDLEQFLPGSFGAPGACGQSSRAMNGNVLRTRHDGNAVAALSEDGFDGALRRQGTTARAEKQMEPIPDLSVRQLQRHQLEQPDGDTTPT